jgi:hypothetical protein
MKTFGCVINMPPLLPQDELTAHAAFLTDAFILEKKTEVHGPWPFVFFQEQGDAAAAQGQWSEALRCWQQALAVAPKDMHHILHEQKAQVRS